MTDMKLGNEPGWCGTFTRAQAAGAIPNGTRVEKVTSAPGDTHPIGSLGTVLGSFAPPKVPGWEHVRYVYFVEWQAHPRIAMAVMDVKIRPRLGEATTT